MYLAKTMTFGDMMQTRTSFARVQDSFGWFTDSYRRLIQMFGKTVLDIDGDLFSDALDALKADRGVKGDTELTAEDLKGLVDTFKGIVKEQTGNASPRTPAPS